MSDAATIDEPANADVADPAVDTASEGTEQ